MTTTAATTAQFLLNTNIIVSNTFVVGKISKTTSSVIAFAVYFRTLIVSVVTAVVNNVVIVVGFVFVGRIIANFHAVRISCVLCVSVFSRVQRQVFVSCFITNKLLNTYICILFLKKSVKKLQNFCKHIVK